MNCIHDTMIFADTFLGIPYRWHHEGDAISDGDKFWVSNQEPPTAAYIREHNKSIVCTGLINLMRRYRCLSIPGLDGSLGDIGLQFPGTTGIWFRYLQERDQLEEFDINKKYPIGTLLLRDFHSIEDQGHVAVIRTEGRKCVLGEDIIHATADDDYSATRDNVGFVRYTRLGISHYWTDPDGYYTHICLPYNWLYID